MSITTALFIVEWHDLLIDKEDPQTSLGRSILTLYPEIPEQLFPQTGCVAFHASGSLPRTSMWAVNARVICRLFPGDVEIVGTKRHVIPLKPPFLG